MLRRSGFGTTGAAVDSVVSEGDLADSVAKMLDTQFIDDAGAQGTPIPAFDSALPKDRFSDTGRTEFVQKLRQQNKALTAWWIRRMVAVDQPALEKLTFLWHNHFATSASAVRSAQLMATQNATIRELCLGDFRVLASAMLTDGAMLRWLNGKSNTAKSPNENLAREFMELFALGHGNGYSEADVREGARALTGWVVTDDEDISFDPARHDAESKSILGVTGNHDASAFRDIVLKHPQSPQFVAGRLWQQLAADSPPQPATLKRLIQAYGQRRNLKALTQAILTDPEFLSGPAMLINGPVDWYIGLLRTLQVPIDDPKKNWDVAMRLKVLGQLPFYPPSVGGWPRGQAWLSTATAGLRLRAATLAAKQGNISPVTDVPPDERIDAVGYLLGIGAWSQQSAKALARYKRDPAALVAIAANTPEYLTT